jgi:hypothetical protein
MYTTYCDFVCTSCKKSTNDTHLWSQFIRGISDKDIRDRLLQQIEDIMTFAKVVEFSLAIETVKTESSQILNPRSETNEHQVLMSSESSGQRLKRNKKFVKQGKNSHTLTRTTPNYNASLSHLFGKCFRFGNETHKADKCKYINAVCSKCNTKGYLHAVCLKSRTSNTHQQQVVDNDDSQYRKRVTKINNQGNDQQDLRVQWNWIQGQHWPQCHWLQFVKSVHRRQLNQPIFKCVAFLVRLN